MGSAGSDVVGVDWRVPLDEARRRVGPDHALQGNLDPALCLAPWPVVEEATRAVLAAAADGTGTGHVFNLGHGVLPESDPGILAAVVDLVHAETARGMTTGVLLMAHGTPASTAEIAALLHAHPPRPPARAGSSWPSSRAATAPSAACRRWPSAPRRRSTRCAPRSRRGRRAATSSRSAPSTPTRSSRRRPRALGAAGLERVIGLVLTPHGSSMGSQEYLDRAAGRAGRDALRAGGPVVRRARRSSRSSPRGAGPRSAPCRAGARVDLHRALAARAHPRDRRHLPRAAGRVGPAGRARRRASTSGSWPGRARDAPPSPGSAPTCATRCAGWRPRAAPTPSSSVPIGFVADHLEVLYDLDVELAGVAAACGLAYARTASLNDDPAFIAVLADVIVAADGAP